MRIELTESAKKFIATLDEADLEKVTITDSVLESDDEGIRTKFEEHIKTRFRIVGDKVRFATTQFKAEHPEYFEENEFK